MGMYDGIRALLRAGADVNGLSRHGTTPLHKAVEYNDPAAAAILIMEGGADIDLVERGGIDTPLHRAALDGDTEMVDLLLKLGASRFVNLSTIVPFESIDDELDSATDVCYRCIENRILAECRVYSGVPRVPRLTHLAAHALSLSSQ